jgi:hypothetical protein
MRFKDAVETPMGAAIISVIIGVGLAAIFRKVCTGDACTRWTAPSKDDVDGKIYKNGDKCHTYTTKTVDCNGKSSIVKALTGGFSF